MHTALVMLNTLWQSVCTGVSLYLCEVLSLWVRLISASWSSSACKRTPHRRKEVAAVIKPAALRSAWPAVMAALMVLKEPCWGETDPTKAQQAPGLQTKGAQPTSAGAMALFSLGCDIPTSSTPYLPPETQSRLGRVFPPIKICLYCLKKSLGS